jgi:nitrogen regulatory protein P-II 1
MSKKSITVLTDVSLITCIVQRGFGDDIVAAAQAAGAQGATVYYARGSGVRERLGILGVAVEVEKAVVNVVVANDQVDRVFESLNVAGELDTPGRGLMYVTPLMKAATYIPKDILDKLESEGQLTDV